MAKRALIADDDETIRVMVQAMLEAEGFSVTSVSDGKAAVETIDQPGFTENLDLIVLDVMMPGMNGLDVLTRIKLHPKSNAIPVIMLTAEKTPEDIMAGYNQGAEYYMTKPFTRQQLMFAISAVLDPK